MYFILSRLFELSMFMEDATCLNPELQEQAMGYRFLDQ